MKKHNQRISLKINDNVIIINGKYKGEKGKIIKIIKKKNSAIVENLNLKTKHQRPIRENEAGSIKQIAAPISISNIALL